MNEKTKNKRTVVSWPFVFIFKRMVFVLTCIYLRNHIALQAQTFANTTILTVIYLFHVQPYNEKVMNFLDSMNEVVSIFVIYFILLFTDFVPDAKVRYMLGWPMIAVTSLAIATHILVMAYGQLKELKLVCKRRKCCKSLTRR